MWTLRLAVFAFTILTLSSCAPFGFNDHRAGVCNQLNSQMIFSGGTSNTRDAEIQMAQQPLMQKTYDADNCNEAPVKKNNLG
jgi:hypothetical protein